MRHQGIQNPLYYPPKNHLPCIYYLFPDPNVLSDALNAVAVNVIVSASNANRNMYKYSYAGHICGRRINKTHYGVAIAHRPSPTVRQPLPPPPSWWHATDVVVFRGAVWQKGGHFTPFCAFVNILMTAIQTFPESRRDADCPRDTWALSELLYRLLMKDIPSIHPSIPLASIWKLAPDKWHI